MFAGSGFLGHSPGLGLSLLDLSHMSSLKEMVIRGGSDIQYQVNNYLQAIWIQVSNCYMSLLDTFMARIILGYQTFGMVQFADAFCIRVF